MRIKTSEKIVYLTFDDAPEEGITEFVLDHLKAFNAHATFFCRGDYAEKNIDLLNLIIENGHSIGNHTYSHINGFEYSCQDYLKDTEKANEILSTHYFRPPWGALTLAEFFALKKRGYNVVYWSLVSEDTLRDKFNLNEAFLKIKTKTKPGDIVLFHCCKRHEKETKQLLPLYLRWLNEQGYKMHTIW